MRSALLSDRRRVILGATALSAAALAPVLLSKAALATPQAAAELLQKLVKGTPRQGRIRLQSPEIADNGNSVPLTVTVESPMTASDHVTAIHVVADGNPAPGVLSVKLGPENGRAEISVRIRLAASERVIAVAEMADGSLWTASREITVTVGGCGAG
ncbi:MAG: thiosulfate oxidation carrier protein SoxY [Alphaproteobacteria bacterium]|nr:thiosulfate oxidation carrier protein SoxY [Alphaproteobacteria bacterium]